MSEFEPSLESIQAELERAVPTGARPETGKNSLIGLPRFCRGIPPSYLAFVQLPGASHLGEWRILDISDSTRYETQAVNHHGKIVLKYHESRYFPIIMLGDGGFLALDVRRKSKGDCPVVLWLPSLASAKHSMPEVHPRFAEFAQRYLRAPALSFETRRAPRLTSTAIDDVCAYLRLVPRVQVGRAPTSAELAQLDTVLAGRAGTYRRFVELCGHAVLCGSVEAVFGLTDDRAYNLLQRRHGVREWGDARERLLPIADDGMGGFYCLDLNHDTDGDCPVVLWDHERFATGAASVRRVSPSFSLWLAKHAKRA